MKVVVTGGQGFVGSWLQKELGRAWKGAEVVSWDLPEVDITEPETYRGRLEKLQPEWLVHLAAIASVPFAAKDPERVRAVNTEASQNMFAAVTALSPNTKLLVASSADVYGRGLGSPLPGRQAGLPELPLSQAQPPNVYAQSKWDMEEIIEKNFNDRVLRVRPFPHIGPGQKLGFVTADFASQIAAIERGGGEPVIRVGNLEAKRDFTDVRDVVRAYRLLMEKGQLGEVYYVASGKAVLIQDVLDQLLALSTVEIAVEQDPDRMRASDIPILVGDAGKLREATGWSPVIPLEQSLKDVLDWWRSNGTASR